MRKPIVIYLLATVLLATASASAQQPTKVPRMGYLSGAPLSANPEALLQGLRDLGYVEGKNVVIEWRSAEGKLERVIK